VIRDVVSLKNFPDIRNRTEEPDHKILGSFQIIEHTKILLIESLKNLPISQKSLAIFKQLTIHLTKRYKKKSRSNKDKAF